MVEYIQWQLHKKTSVKIETVLCVCTKSETNVLCHEPPVLHDIKHRMLSYPLSFGPSQKPVLCTYRTFLNEKSYRAGKVHPVAYYFRSFRKNSNIPMVPGI